MIYFSQLFIAFLLDIFFGDPHWYPHPVRIMGKICDFSESFTRKYIASDMLAGMVTVLTVTVSSGTIALLLVTTAYSVAPLLGDIVSIVLFYTTIAAKDLLRHSNIVYTFLTDENSLDNARQALGQIVGRDTQELSKEEVSKACIETVAENMVDGITAPLFFGIFAGMASPFLPISPIGCSVVGAFVYKSVNTLDSMIGYKNDIYIENLNQQCQVPE